MAERATRLLVAGAGMAGLSAALAAAEAGGEVTVLEKAGEVGGAARLSAGLIWTLPAFELHRKHVPEGDAELQRTLSENFAGALAWLEQHALEPPRQVLGDGWGRVMATGSPGRREGFLAAVKARAEAAGARILLARRLVSLERAEPGSLSVQVETPDGWERWKARSVVLATGGYQGNRELLARYLGPASDYLMIRSWPACTGDGFLAALALGAATSRGLGSFYGHSMPAAPIPPEEYQTITPYFASVGVLVNRYGNRFTDESAGIVEEANPGAGMHQPDGRYYLIFDLRVYREHVLGPGLLGGTVPAPNKYERARALGAPVLEAPTLPELVTAMENQWNINGPRLLAELETYNRAASSGHGAALVPPRSRNLQPLTEAPFFAMACVPAITFPYGGLRVDRSLRVLDAMGVPLSGLYAAGVDAGGVFNRVYAGGLAWALVSGRLAGLDAARAS